MEVRLPRLGEGADSGAVATIFVKEGDVIKKDQSILELESEKAVASIPSPAAGTVTKIHVKEGDEIRVGQAILSLAEDGAAEEKPKKKTGQSKEEVKEQPVAAEPEEPQEEVEEEPVEARAATPGIQPPASPTIRRLARQLGVDLNRVRGSERGGRIVMADVRKYIQRLQQTTAAKPVEAKKGVSPSEAKPVESIDFAKWGSVKKEKMSKLREAISAKMAASWTTIPHVTQFDDADITKLLTLRKKYKGFYEKQGAGLTLTPFILKALVAVLQKHPRFNASLDETTGEIVYKKYYHFGIAVDTEQGLIVPVIRDVDKKSLLDLSKELNQLAGRTRQRKVSLDEMQGGSFTISNQGGIGGAHFTPIVNKPEVAILGMGRGAVKPVFRKNKTENRMLLPLGLSYDHRVIDGADAARFITDLVQAIENFPEDEVKIDSAKTEQKKGAKKGKK